MTYLVPFDFTPTTENALSYALTLTQGTDTRILLVHIVKSNGDVSKAESRLADVAAAQDASVKNRIDTKVVAGDIFEDIAKVAKIAGAELIVMGTHGMSGLQHLLGSKAIKVITSSTIPFVVVQNKLIQREINKIVMAFDLSKESIQIVRFAAQLAARYDAEVHLLGGEQTDEWLINKSRSNIKFAHDYLSKEGVRHKAQLLPRNNFAERVLNYSKENGVDMIAVGYVKEALLPQFDTFTQTLITNPDGLPVLVINAEQVYSVSGQYSFLTT